MGLDVRMLPLDVLPDVGEGIAVELTDPTLVVLLPIVSATTKGGDPQRELRLECCLLFIQLNT